MKTKKVLSRHCNSKNTKKRIIKSSSNSKSSINSKSNKKSIKRTNITRKRGYISKGGGVEGSKYVPPHMRKEDDIEVFTNTDHYIGYKKGEKYYYVSPYELNTAVLQYLVDNDKLVYGLDTHMHVKEIESIWELLKIPFVPYRDRIEYDEEEKL